MSDDFDETSAWPGRSLQPQPPCSWRRRSSIESSDIQLPGDPEEPGADAEFPSDGVSPPGHDASQHRAIHDPALLCAMLLVHRLLRQERQEGRDLYAAPCVALEAPADWIEMVSLAWRILMAEDAAPATGLDRRDDRFATYSSPDWILIARTDEDRKAKPSSYNDSVAQASLDGTPILGISPDPQRLLPRALMRGADARLLLPRCDDKILRTVCRLLWGRTSRATPDTRLDDDLAGSVSPTMLRLACRRGLPPEAWMTRLADFLRADAAPTDNGVTLADLAGMDDVVAWGEDLARDLCEVKAGTLAITAVDRGALLAGPPGTGKTTAAQALANSCGVPLIATSYAAWQAHGEGHLGDVTRALRETFAQARALAPCLLFIDELDTVQSRGRSSHSDDWWTAIINCLIEQLDGLEDRRGVVVVAATNFPDTIDPVILRSGRLDRVIHIPLPNAQALVGILRYHLKGDLASADLAPLAERLARRSATGADVEHLLRGARRRARHARRVLELPDLGAELGEEPVLPPTMRWRHAVHESGHALAAEMAEPGSVVRLSIRDHGGIGGATEMHREPTAITRELIERTLRMLLAGRAAEEILLGAPSSGSGGAPDSDLARANRLAADAVLTLGLGKGRRALLWRPAAIGDIPEDARAEIGTMLEAAYASARALVRTHEGAVRVLARRLFEETEIEGADISVLLKHRDCQRRSKNAAARRSKIPSRLTAAGRPVRGALRRHGHSSGGVSGKEVTRAVR